MKKFSKLDAGELFKFSNSSSICRAKICRDNNKVFWEYEQANGFVFDIGADTDVLTKVTKTIEVWE